MKKIAKWLSSHPMVECGIICLITGVLSFVYFIVKGNGTFTLRDDFNAQQIPFNISMHNAVLSARQWTWSLDLGTPTIQGFSFYGLGGIYFWLSLLFPVSAFPYVIGWMYVLKYVVAGCTSFCYLKQYVKNPKYAIIGALLYAFSGFQTANLEFYHFHDVVSMFPLLLIGMDRMMSDSQKTEASFSAKPWLNNGGALLFILAVAINCLCNYYFFVGQVVFLILYFLVRYARINKKTIGDMLRCLICGVWGVAIAAVLFLPSALYIMGNTRNVRNFTLSGLFYDPLKLLFIIKNFLLPAEAMNDISAVISQDWCSTSAYLPLVGITCVLAYLCAKKKDWLSRFLKLLFVIGFVPLLTSAFTGFSEVTQRWYYMLILFMSASSIKVLEDRHNPEYHLDKWIAINSLSIIVFFLLVRFLKWNKYDADVLVFHKSRFLLYTVVSLCGMAVFWFLQKVDLKKFCLLMTAGVSAFSIVTTGLTIYFYRMNSDSDIYPTIFNIGLQLEPINDQYRYINSIGNVGLYLPKDQCAPLSSFSSTVTNSITEFDALFDYSRNNFSLSKTSYPGLAELLGGKFYFSGTPVEGQDAIRSYQEGNLTWYLYEKAACPIGFSVNQYITKEDLGSLDVSQRAVAMLNAIVVSAEDEQKVAETGLLKKMDISVFKKDIADFQPLVDEYVALNSSNAVQNFNRNDNGFTCETNYKQDSFVYFSVPFSRGWTATIDGNRQDIVESGGMMAIRVPQGEHEIIFVYNTPGFYIGAIITLISLAGYILLIIASTHLKLL
ncbi:MAG: YfhO family protein [Lachnospiraceae bacterium]